MRKTETRPAKVRLQLSDAENRVFTVKSAAGREIGFAVGGCATGPGLVVAGTGDDAETVFRRILDLPGLPVIKGRLVLLNMDRLDLPGDLAELDRLAACVRPVTDTFFLATVALGDAGAGAAQTETLVQAVLGFCARHGMDLLAKPPNGHTIRDFAS